MCASAQITEKRGASFAIRVVVFAILAGLVDNPPLYVLEPQVVRSQETIDDLKRLLADAEAGHLIGLALVALYGAKGCTTEVIGAARLSPIFTTGAVHRLQRKLDSITS